MSRRLVETPTVTANGKTLGRRRTAPPRDAARQIEDLAADGWSMVGIAMKLEVGRSAVESWLKRDADLKAAFDRGRERERQTLHNVLYRRATEKQCAVSAMFLLKSRHGYKEGEHEQQQNARVQISFSLPGAMKPEQIVIENEPRLPVE